MHPDQLYTVRQLQHHDLQAEIEQARVRRELASNPTAWGRIWLATWLQRLGIHQTHATTPTSGAESATAAQARIPS